MKTVSMWSRRHFLERLSRLPLVGGAIAAGTYTAMTASLIPPAVIGLA